MAIALIADTVKQHERSLFLATQSAISHTVLIITTQSDYGGVPRHIRDLLKAFRYKLPGEQTRVTEKTYSGTQIEFYIASPTDKPFGPLFKKLAASHTKISNSGFTLSDFFAIWRLVQKEEIAVIHSHGYSAGLHSRLLGVLTRFGRQISLVLNKINIRVKVIHSPQIIHTFHGLPQVKSKSSTRQIWLGRILSHTHFISIFTSQVERNAAWKYGFSQENSETYVVESAIDFERFQGRDRLAFQDQSEIVSEFILNDSRTRLKIGTFLRPDHKKGPDRFLRFVQDHRSLADFSCVGTSRSELKKFGDVPPWLEVIGTLDEPAPWLQDLDIYLSMVRTDDLPLGVLEAMAAGTPCILSEIPAHRNFKMAKAALLYDPQNPESLLKEIESLRNDGNLRREILKNSRTLIHEQYTLSLLREHLAAIYAPRVSSTMGSNVESESAKS